ncbi:hypothetical protein LX59_01089 [Azomonas agilis]|uniref:TIGR03862 family flavoprotein n=1 Tax=Azomonas agilis TaxID=116849 RepID=A0A562IZ99_9GAMM|nr:TIGR03862 family flavoprotein [Azomonas agilis]TWH76170.1 hypothetical protein LX59_01089 [Azomonas agilis]
MTQPYTTHPILVIGAGPAGLMAAEVLSQSGYGVSVFDAMPSVGRKFLRAGIGGLNLTHAEPFADFVRRYGAKSTVLRPILDSFNPVAVSAWAQSLGIETFVGSSGRVFPRDMKAAPLLRAWLHRLRQQGVSIHTRHYWRGWNEQGAAIFDTPEGEKSVHYAAILLALGGASWPQLGSDGRWVNLLQERQIPITPLQPANCGFEVEAWSPHLKQHWAGAPLKGVILSHHNQPSHKGECILTQHGLEGGLIYTLAVEIRQEILQKGQALVHLDLVPERSLDQVIAALSQSRGSKSLSTHLKRQLGLEGPKTALIYELTSAEIRTDARQLAQAIKGLPIYLKRPRPLAEAISTAGGVSFEALDQHLMVQEFPGIFCAGEMLDWEAPTGGYLLTACFATGHWAAQGIMDWLRQS